MRSKYPLLVTIALFTLLVSLGNVSASDPPNVTLASPGNGAVNSSSNNLTFFCNVTDDHNVHKVSFYSDINGSFALAETKNLMEVQKTSDTLLLCHYNNSFVCEDGEQATNSSTTFVDGKFMKGVIVNGSGYVRYPTTDNILLQQGTVEFWVKFGADPAAASNVILFDTSKNLVDDLRIRLNYNMLYFDMYDNDGYLVGAYKNVSTWSQGEWHHIAVVWDVNEDVGPSGESAYLFVDGSNASITYHDDGYFYYVDTIGSFMYLGSKDDGTKQSNSVFDEFRVSDQVLTPNQINESYMIGALSHSNEQVNFSVNNIADGEYNWNCLGLDNESQTDWGDSNYSFNIDISTAPVTNVIYLSPNHSDQIDPDMSINVTANITDHSGVSTVIFQWKETGDWNNDTMDYNAGSGLYENATITVDVTGGVYQYRTWSNDSNGNSGFSNTLNFTADFDYSWNLTTNGFGNVSGLINSLDNIGFLIINNTGDDTLDFSITDDWPLAVYYNGSDTPSFTVPAKQVINVTVNATFEGQDIERDITINVSATHGSENPVPGYSLVNATLNTYSGGPFLSATITTIPTSVEQGQTNVTLTATIKNIGNETAQGVWINWTLPEGWTNISGSEINLSIGNISSQITNTTSINFSIQSSAENGISTICANSSGNNGLNSSDCGLVIVSCSNTDSVCGNGCTYLTDSDCEPASSGGGSSGSSGSVLLGYGGTQVLSYVYGIGIDAPKQIDVFRGQNLLFKINVSNTELGTVINNGLLSISGHPKTLIKIDPSSFSDLVSGENKTIDITVDAPDYFSYGKYNLTLTVTGIAESVNYSSNETKVTDTEQIILFIRSVSEKETLDLLENTELGIKKMEESGFYIGVVDSLLEQAKTALNDFDYDKSKDILDQISDIEKKSFSVDTTIKTVKNHLEEAKNYGIESPDTEKMYSLSISAFERGDYDRAEERANTALLTYSIESGNMVMILNFLHKYWIILIIITVVVIAGFITGKKKIKSVFIKKRIKFLDKEEKVVKELIKDLQKRTFDLKKVGKHEYENSIDFFHKKLAWIQKERAVLFSTKVKLGGRTIKNWEKERKRIKKLIIQAQKGFFEDRNISKTVYNETMSQLREELAEIEKNIEKRTKKVKKNKNFVLLFMVFCSFLLIGNVIAQTSIEQAQDSIENAELVLEEMSGLGFKISRANDTILEAKLLLEEGKYSEAEKVADYVNKIKQNAIDADKLIDDYEEMEFDLKQMNLNTDSARSFFDEALIENQNQRYENAKELLEKAITELGDIEAGHSLEGTLKTSEVDKFIGFIQSNLEYVVAFIIIMLVLLSIITWRIKSHKKKNHINSLIKEKGAIESMLRNIQIKYFERDSMSKSEYHLALNKYEKRLQEIKKDIILSKNQEKIKI